MANTHSIKHFIYAKPYDRSSERTINCGLLKLSLVQYHLCPESLETDRIAEKPVICSQFFHTINHYF
jgi:hypothetical protein